MLSKQPLPYIVLMMLLFLSGAATLCIGASPYSTPVEELVHYFSEQTRTWHPLLHEKIPRILVILCSGSSLAVSGAVTQALFNNPLASPSVLGISFGSSLCVMISFIFGWHLTYPYVLPIAAFGGCMTTLLVVYALSNRKGPLQIESMILTGIAISTLLLAVQGALLYALRDKWHLIQTLTEWESGNTFNKSWKDVHIQLPLTLIGLWGCWIYRYEVDILSLGEEEALNLGVDVPKARFHLFLCVSLLTGGTVATMGVISFFGLVLPHLFRIIFGAKNRQLIPLCILGGGAFLLHLDLILRYFEITALSIGNISALLGGLFFLILLMRQKPAHSRESLC